MQICFNVSQLLISAKRPLIDQLVIHRKHSRNLWSHLFKIERKTYLLFVMRCLVFYIFVMLGIEKQILFKTSHFRKLHIDAYLSLQSWVEISNYTTLDDEMFCFMALILTYSMLDQSALAVRTISSFLFVCF